MTNDFMTLALVAGWIVTVFVGLMGLAIVVLIAAQKIKLDKVLEEPGTEKASLSRLQFLIFTFVIAMSLFLVIVGDGTPAFPKEIPVGILALLGISGGTYAVSKGVESNKAVEMAKANVELEKTKLV